MQRTKRNTSLLAARPTRNQARQQTGHEESKHGTQHGPLVTGNGIAGNGTQQYPQQRQAISHIGRMPNLAGSDADHHGIPNR